MTKEFLKISAIFLSAILALNSCGQSTDAKYTTKHIKLQPAAQSLSTNSHSSSSQACLAEAMFFEARGTGTNGMRAVGEVVLNRANSSRFPNSVCGVIDEKYKGNCQFSYRCNKIAKNYRNNPEFRKANEIAQTLLTNRGQDITNGALFFHAARVSPSWFKTLSPRGKFGGNHFYR